MRILRNKKILILSITAIALLTLTIGVSYAYFTATVTGNDSAVVTKIVAGILDVDFTITDRISNDNILLIKDEKREEKAETLDFTVSNNGRGTLDAVYYVYLTDLNITNNLKSQDFKWELIKNDDTVFTGNFSSAETNTDFTITSETNNGIVIPVKQELSVGQVDRYKLRIWLSEKEEDQNSLLNGSFSGKVRVTSTQLTGSEKYVVFKDQSGTQLGKKIISDGKTNYTMDMSSVNLTGSTNIYCNNGGIPTISNNTLNIDGVTNNVECKISNDIMDTIANQLTTSKTGIVMTNDQDDITRMTITDKEVVFDLNGKIINTESINTTSTSMNASHHGLQLIGATLTINDSVGTGELNTGKDGRTLYVNNNSNLTINGGSYTGRQTISTDKSCHITINDGTFESNLYDTIYLSYSNNVDLVINGGTFINRTVDTAVISIPTNTTNTTITINGGSFNGNSRITYNDSSTSSIIINNGNFESEKRVIYNLGGNLTINNGTFVSSGGEAVENLTGTTTINNGTFTSGSDSQGFATIRNREGTMYINGGNIKSINYNTVVLGDTATTVFNGTKAVFDANNNYVSGLYIHNQCPTGNPPNIFNFGDLTIYDGTFECGKNHAALENAGTLKIYDGEFYGVSSNVSIYFVDGTSYVYGGTFKGFGTGSYGNREHDSKNYICGGTITNAHVYAPIDDAFVKYKSNVVWQGASGPSITGSYPSTVSLDDTITCPS